jgi:catechol 2,3-dioxygenase-like lactoylglutathione lyase family enzyme
MLSHAAFISSDTSATVDFYAGVLGMELVAAVLDDSIPSTGEPIPYFHSFFRMGDGSTIAFFEAPELPPPSADSHPAYATFRHFAMEVDSTATVDAWAAWLRSNGVEVLGPVDHKIIYSVYFRDPDGNRLEITTPTDPRWNDDAEAARASLAEWERVKTEARSTGRDMATVLADLTRERSHRRSAGLGDAGRHDRHHID